MPIYEYECTKCGNRFELRRRLMDSDDDIKCPKCGVLKPRRVISRFSTGQLEQGCAPGSST
jgi:putative FmdB family regulatory protein